MKTITISVSPAGTVVVDAEGFAGNECDKATETIELVLGGGEAKKDRKPEYYQPTGTHDLAKNVF